MAQIKNTKEIQLIKHACKLTDAIFERMKRNFVFKTEKQLEQRILAQIKKAGCKPSFPPIVAAGANAAHPHWKPSDTKLKGFVVIDFGLVYKHYMSDMTRTIYVGKPSKQEKELYQLVLQSQLDGINFIKPGRSCKDSHIVVAKTLWDHNQYFIHSLGHGIGTRIHEWPRISPRSKKYFQKNMCVTVEPWVYIKDKLWIRIEDTCLVTENGCERLTVSSKKLYVIY